MSTFVLNRNYGLELPTSYVEVDNEEMEYVEGGSITINRSTIRNAIWNAVGYIGAAMTVASIAKTVVKYAPKVARFILGAGPFAQIAAVILAGCIAGSAIALGTIYLSGGSITLG